jgi:hypothetical protein
MRRVLGRTSLLAQQATHIRGVVTQLWPPESTLDPAGGYWEGDPEPGIVTVRGCGQRPAARSRPGACRSASSRWVWFFGDLPGDPSGDITAGWGRTKRVNAIGACRSSMVDSGDLGRAAVECSGEAIEGILATLVGEVGA